MYLKAAIYPTLFRYKDIENMNAPLQKIDANFKSLQIQYASLSAPQNAELISSSNKIVSKINALKSDTREKLLLVTCVTLLIIGILVLIFEKEDFSLFFVFSARIISANMLRYLDLHTLYETKCYVENPFFVSQLVKESNKCMNVLSKANFLRTLEKHENISENLEFECRPLTEKNEINHWQIKNMTAKAVFKKYWESIHTLKDEHFCNFNPTNSIEVEPSAYIKSHANMKDTSKFQVTWESCHKNASKIVKKLLRRPRFLPANFELVAKNWIFAASKNAHRDFVQVPTMYEIIMYCQIRGNATVKMYSTICTFNCQEKRFVLHEHQTLVYTHAWKIEVKPSSEQEFLALALYGYF